MTTDSSLCLDNLIIFADRLRRDGLPVPAAGAAAAARILAGVDLSERGQARDALMALMASGLREQHIFAAAFDEYFVSEDEQEENRLR
ncbi:MAG: hypothetical protein LBQ16_06580 [Gracilibacteraceae bacterium]|jgi:uncharacterized protein with von Willebrand factor type A (vWA) domain|nr:hypothetical protein [Gracilibacteraceae bacterium]